MKRKTLTLNNELYLDVSDIVEQLQGKLDQLQEKLDYPAYINMKDLKPHKITIHRELIFLDE
jgi:hypothetical protein